MKLFASHCVLVEYCHSDGEDFTGIDPVEKMYFYHDQSFLFLLIQRGNNLCVYFWYVYTTQTSLTYDFTSDALRFRMSYFSIEALVKSWQ